MLATIARPDQHPAEVSRVPRADGGGAGGGPRPGRPCAARWRLGLVLAAMGMVMIPWVFHLGVSLPASAVDAHWALAWVGLDSCEAVALFGTGVLLLRGDNRCALTAAATAVLLLIDAWFDITSAASGSELTAAIVMAVCTEIPIAAGCAALALRLIRRPFPLPPVSAAG